MFLFVKTVKYWVYFFDFSVKNHEGVVGELQNSNHIWFMSCTEKHQKITKFSGHPFIVNLTFENIQIFHLYLHNLDHKRYLDSVFKGYVQLVPNNFIRILSAACVNCN